MATDEELGLVHDPLYIAMVKLAGSGPARQDNDLITRALLMYGLGTGDDPVFPRMHQASALIAGSTLAAARAVWTSAVQHGASIAEPPSPPARPFSRCTGCCRDRRW
jgi:acetoin utilization protein AcuC